MSSSRSLTLLSSLCGFWLNRVRDTTARPCRNRLEVECLEDRFVPSLTTLASGLGGPLGVAVDANGNVFIADTANNAIKEWIKASNTIVPLVSSGLSYPEGVAVDGSGNVFIADSDNGAIEEWSSGTLTTLVSGLFLPTGVAVDGSGNVFIAEYGRGVVDEWVASSNTLTTLVSPLNGPSGVAVDGMGNVYIASYGDSTIKEWVKSSNSVSTLISSGLTNPFGVALDGRGNLYIGDAGDHALKEWLASSNTVTTLVSSNLSFPSGVAVDASGDVYIADEGDNTIKEFVPPPSITAQPQNASATVGQSGPGSLMVSASGVAPLSYQWQISTDSGATFTNLTNGSGVSGATTSTLTLSGFASAGSAEYQVIVTDGNNQIVTSNAATFTINSAPSITTQPQNATATAGQSAPESFIIAVTGGTGPLSLQWQISMNNGVSFTNLINGGSGIAGVTTTTLTLNGFAAAGAAEYRAVVTDVNGVMATSNAAILTINDRPSVTIQPANPSATSGQAGSESFSVLVAKGTGPFTYQWQVSTDGGNTFTNLSNGSGISGATAATLTISSSALPDSATEYQVVVTDANSVMVTSSAATLTINPAPFITTQPQNAIATAGQSGPESFSIAVGGGTGPFSVQWQISTDNGSTFSNLSNGSGVAGATSTTLSVSGFSAPGAAAYRALVSDANGVMATSNAATLTINIVPLITSQPQNATATVGQSAPVSFSLAASGGTGPLAVRWQVSTDNASTFINLSDSSGVSGSATTTLIISNFLSVSSAEYQAVVTDANGVTATSNAATLNTSPSSADPNQNWLMQVYADLFRRALDPSGLASWSTLLNQGVSRTQVVLLIEASLEYRTDVVDALYAQLLHRPADASGLSAFTAFLGNGGTALQVEAAILGSLEYFQLHGGTNDGFLTAVYQDVLNRSPDPTGAQSWGLALAGGSTRETVVQAILASLESDADQVQSLFREFLRRAADSGGLNSFTTALQQGVAAETAIAGIVGSDEYFGRVQ
jgi:sugar lactone lactonase YvrE